MDKKINIIASNKTWLEDLAVEQLKQTANLKGIEYAIGLPDLHPGKAYPIGAVLLSKGIIYPHLVGSDIGCGMGFYKTDLKIRKIKLDKLVRKLDNLDEPWSGDAASYLKDRNMSSSSYDNSMGTIGGGNHFAELQKVVKVIDPEAFNQHNLVKDNAYLLVHSGSRGLGESILRNFTTGGYGPAITDSNALAIGYLAAHDNAVQWARLNRGIIAERFCQKLSSDFRPIFDYSHNTVSKHIFNKQKYWLHRKGANPADCPITIIPGSRGSYSYLVAPIYSGIENGFSLAHGAGRKWKRSETKDMLRKYKASNFIKTELGSMVICENKHLIYEEAPQAYKNIDVVIQDLIDAKLIKVVAILSPLITYKTRKGR